jgi:hypothetical protein
MYLFTPHNKDTAGRHFDELYANKAKLIIIDLKLASKKMEYSARILAILIAPFCGIFTALTMSRLLFNSKFWGALQYGELHLSRSLFIFLFLFRVKSNVIYHNIESLYYYEEYIAERKLWLKLAYLHQFLILTFFEKKGLSKSHVTCLSNLEYRYLRYNGIKSSFSVKNIFSESKDLVKIKALINNSDCELPYCFFGAYNNSRNIKMLDLLVRKYPHIKLFGRHGVLLPNYMQPFYFGEVDDLSKIVKKYKLIIADIPRAGIQTKVIDWVEAGGCVQIPLGLSVRMGINEI